jgi:hypothetical protein
MTGVSLSIVGKIAHAWKKKTKCNACAHSFFLQLIIIDK